MPCQQVSNTYIWHLQLHWYWHGLLVRYWQKDFRQLRFCWVLYVGEQEIIDYRCGCFIKADRVARHGVLLRAEYFPRIDFPRAGKFPHSFTGRRAWNSCQWYVLPPTRQGDVLGAIVPTGSRRADMVSIPPKGRLGDDALLAAKFRGGRGCITFTCTDS